MKTFYNIYYFNIECINKYYAPLKYAKYNNYNYNSNNLAFTSLIYEGLYNLYNNYNFIFYLYFRY